MIILKLPALTFSLRKQNTHLENQLKKRETATLKMCTIRIETMKHFVKKVLGFEIKRSKNAFTLCSELVASKSDNFRGLWWGKNLAFQMNRNF